MHFISIVGNQTMATLNPLLALIKADRKPAAISLLCTPGSRSHAERLLQVLPGLGFPSEAVDVAMISDSLRSDRNGPPAPAVCRALRERGDIVFNLAGGIGFQIPACARALDRERTLFIYPEMERIMLLRFTGGGIETEALPLPPALDVLELFTLQGVEWQPANETSWPLLNKALAAARMKRFPDDGLCNVRIASLDFACVLNRGNRLKFLHVIEGASGKNGRDADMKKARAVIALGKSDLGQLFDREIHVLTDSAAIAERLLREKGLKVFPHVFRHDRSGEMGAKLFLQSYLAERTMVPKGARQRPEEIVHTGGGSSSDRVLYVMLGTEPLPTLLAVWSHRAGEVNFLYTPDNSQVAALRDAFVANGARMPVARFRFIPVSFGGEEIAALPAPGDSSRVDVNLTPGTKLQKTILALWAARHGVACFTVSTRPDQLVPLDGGVRVDRLPVRTPPADCYLKLGGITVQRFGRLDKGQLLRSHRINAAYGFLAAAARQPDCLADFPRRAIALPEVGFTPLENHYGRLSLSDGTEAEILCGSGGEKGEWFEEAVGLAFSRAGVTGVQLNIRLAWSDQRKAALKKLTGTESPMAEIDVVAWQGAAYYVVSCKATKVKDLRKNVNETRAYARPFGRMAVPVLAFLKHGGEPYVVDGVQIIGPKTLADPKAMGRFLEEARARLATTGRAPEDQ